MQCHLGGLILSDTPQQYLAIKTNQVQFNCTKATGNHQVHLKVYIIDVLPVYCGVLIKPQNSVQGETAIELLDEIEKLGKKYQWWQLLSRLSARERLQSL